jgi:molecular chaperone GrpE
MSEENLAASEKELSDAVDEVLNEATVVVDEVATLTSDLQRLQAEYANYRKRVDRDLSLIHISEPTRQIH